MRLAPLVSRISLALLAACSSSSSGGDATTGASSTASTTATGAGGAGGGATTTTTGTGGATGTTTTTSGTGGATTTTSAGGAGGATTTTGVGGAGGQTWTSACAAGLVVELAPVIAGLLYTSESDYPFENWSANDSGSGAITPAHLLELLALPPGTQTETRTVDEFFAWPLQGPDAAKYQQLHDVLTLRLTDLVVIRIFDPANQAEVHVYVVGRTGCAEIAGVRTIAIET